MFKVFHTVPRARVGGGDGEEKVVHELTATLRLLRAQPVAAAASAGPDEGDHVAGSAANKIQFC